MSLFGRSEPFVSEWFSAQPGSEVPWTGGRDVVRSIAVYDLEVVDGEPGDGHRVTLVWPEKGDPVFVNLDIYGDMEDAEIVHDIEPVDPTAWTVARGSLVPGQYVTGDSYGGEPERMTLDRATGPDAGDCPATGWFVHFFLVDSKNVDRSWVVLYDSLEVPRVAFASRVR